MMEEYVEDDELVFDEDQQLVPTTKESQLVERTKQLVEGIMDVEDSDELKRVTALFNQNLAKKNMLRLLKVGNVLDVATDEVMKRLLNDPDNISDGDLAKFYAMLQKASTGYLESINGIGENPVISITNQTINVDKPALTSESQQRVLDAYNLLMKMSKGAQETKKMDEVEIVEERNEE